MSMFLVSPKQLEGAKNAVKVYFRGLGEFWATPEEAVKFYSQMKSETSQPDLTAAYDKIIADLSSGNRIVSDDIPDTERHPLADIKLDSIIAYNTIENNTEITSLAKYIGIDEGRIEMQDIFSNELVLTDQDAYSGLFL